MYGVYGVSAPRGGQRTVSTAAASTRYRICRTRPTREANPTTEPPSTPRPPSSAAAAAAVSTSIDERHALVTEFFFCAPFVFRVSTHRLGIAALFSFLRSPSSSPPPLPLAGRTRTNTHTHTHTHWHVDQDNMSPEGSGPLNNPFIGLMNDGERRAGGFRRRGPTRRRVGKNPTQPARIGRGATTSLCGVREKIKPELGEPSRETKGRENATKRTRQKKRNQRKTSR